MILDGRKNLVLFWLHLILTSVTINRKVRFIQFRCFVKDKKTSKQFLKTSNCFGSKQLSQNLSFFFHKLQTVATKVTCFCKTLNSFRKLLTVSVYVNTTIWYRFSLLWSGGALFYEGGYHPRKKKIKKIKITCLELILT